MYPIIRPNICFFDFLRLFNIFSYSPHKIKQFENEFAIKFNRKFACVFPSGRAGLNFLLKSLSFQNKIISLSSYTCIVVPYAIEQAGSKLTFVEPFKNEFNVNAKELASQSSIILLTHMFGEMADSVKPEGVFMIEDCCLSYGSEKDGVKGGTLGDVSFFSLNQSKQVSCLGGGIFLTDNVEIYNKLKSLTSYKIHPIKEFLFLIKILIYYIFYKKPIYFIFKKLLNFNRENNFSLSENNIDVNGFFLVGQAIIGLSQLCRLSKTLIKRQEIAIWYDKYLGEIEGVVKPKIEYGVELSHYWLILKKDREPIRKELLKRGINTGIANEYSCPTTPYYKSQYKSDDFAWSTYIGDHIINLPFYIGLTEKDVKKICKIFKEVYENN